KVSVSKRCTSQDTEIQSHKQKVPLTQSFHFCQTDTFTPHFPRVSAGAVLKVSVPKLQHARVGSATVLPCTFYVDKCPVNPQLISIVWQFRGEEILSYHQNTVKNSRPDVSLDAPATKDGIASLSLSNVTIADGGIYKCLVTYSSDQQEKEVMLEVQVPPKMKITKDHFISKEEKVLQCSLTGFYPMDIAVTWLRDGKVMKGASQIEKLVPQRNSDGTYRVNSTVTITPTEDHEDVTFSCNVQHTSLEEPIQKDFQLLHGCYRIKYNTSSLAVTLLVFFVLLTGAVITGSWFIMQKCKTFTIFLFVPSRNTFG
ncbi:hypothetical protein FKM82_021870, partial [Ascaphus truei]